MQITAELDNPHIEKLHRLVMRLFLGFLFSLVLGMRLIISMALPGLLMLPA